jgi:predicted peptidase
MPAIARAITSQFEDFALSSASSGSLRARLLRPEPIAPGQKYPLLVFLHGAGERGSDNVAQLKYLPEWMAESEHRVRYPCFLLAPQCPSNEWWIDVDWSGPRPRMTASTSSRLASVVEMIDVLLEAEPIDADRQYLTGISMGGFATWDLAIRMPDRFAAVVPVCGGGDTARAGALVNTPVWCFHGEVDDIVPPEHSREMIHALRAAGGAPYYSELIHVGHNSWTPAYRNSKCLEWMFEQRG